MRILGLDGGIASIGWAVLIVDPAHDIGKIEKCGTHMFNSPEGQSSTGAKILKNVERRTHRSQRKNLHRRRQRMAKIRSLFKAHRLLDSDMSDALAGHGADPWELRSRALDSLLNPFELALALGHIAKHRGFKSTKKGEKANSADEASKMLTAIDTTRERLAQYRTIGEMLARDPVYAVRKRNRDNDYTRSLLRDDQKYEVQKIFEAQRKRGSLCATQDLQETFEQIAFFQRPLQSSLELVGECPFVDGEKRATTFAPSFEKFRFLSKLVTLRIVEGRALRVLTKQEITAAAAVFGANKTFSWKALRNALSLAPDASFDRVSPDHESKDFVRSVGTAAGTKTLMNILTPILGEVSAKSLLDKASQLDAAMTVIAFNEDMAEIRNGLHKCELPSEAIEALCRAAEEGTFNFVKGAGHISCAAARQLNPHIAGGLRYDQACAAEGWNHTAQSAWELESITSPVAQKAVREILKQVKALEREYGPFDRVHVEMARDVGKSIEERGKIERGLNKRTAEREKAENSLKELLKVDHVNSEAILRYELWKEQNGRCVYTGKGICPTFLLAGDNTVQVDHILPFSRFGDNSFHNKTLCYTSANQTKQNRTPFEWKNLSDPADWERFRAEIESLKTLKGLKKRNYLLMDAPAVEEKFLARNLNDTRFALRVLLGLLRQTHPDFVDGTDKNGRPIMRRRVFARPGGIIAALRRAWGLESLKKDPATGERRLDDRHHALDAIVTACCSEGLLQRATRHAQLQEQRGEKFEMRELDAPWGEPGVFRREVNIAVQNVFVSRPESGRLRGKGHDAGIKQIREIDGEEILFERMAVTKLKISDLHRIPVPKPYGNIVDPEKLRDQLVENLRDWIVQRDKLDAKIKAIKEKSEEKAILQSEFAALTPLSPKGDAIKKVRLKAKNKKAVNVRGGSAVRSMVRVDVFSKPNKKGLDEYYFVPIYRNDVFTRDKVLNAAPPNCAIVANKPEMDWPKIDDTYTFKFSIVSFSLVEVVSAKGAITFGYFRNLDSSTGAIAISAPEHSTALYPRIGGKTLKSFKKLRVDRLGNIHEVKQEKRTWRGKVCT